MINKTATRLAILLAHASAPGMLFAAEATDSFTVGAEVSGTCTVTATDLDFGTVDVTATGNTDATSTISVTCTSGTDYDIGLDGGGAGDVGNREMSDGATGILEYALYSDSGHSVDWGDVIDTDTVADTGTGTADDHTVYGRVPDGQTTVTAGSYSDTINVTVTY
ncbi:MAG: spore coat U domain-containing protein [Aquisalimonadaceae bacterium]